MARPGTVPFVMVVCTLACLVSLLRAAAQAPVVEPMGGLCPPIGQPCPTPEGCYPAITSEEWFCANMAGSCCQYTHRHLWFKDVVTGETCDPADCVDYTFVAKKEGWTCAPSHLCIND